MGSSLEDEESLKVDKLLQWIRDEYAAHERADDPAVAKERASWDAISARRVPTASGDRILVTSGPLASCKLPLPQSCILTEDKVTSSAIGKVFAGLDKYSLFALFLLWQERLPTSHWRYYLDVLPRDIGFHPITYLERADSSPELKAALEAQQLLHRALVAQKEKLEAEWERVQSIIASHHESPEASSKAGDVSELEGLLGKDAPSLSFEQFRWANCMVISRAFNLGDVPPTMCMIPFVDSMNHDSKAPTVKWLRKLFSGFFVMKVPKHLEEGTELTASYHETPKEAKAKEMAHLRSFLMYGFVEDCDDYDKVQQAANAAIQADASIDKAAA
eukprot:TRINITY_DN26211_c0_g1_i1.p1 TRINITY_DN26211_c0_g1~~TRINITY_DN26211_c0_g1_i1.p1  ORF type:complete len:332 (+),score=70.03 TRINITY_DN26211_c0_g1_i1:32-1027(+)